MILMNYQKDAYSFTCPICSNGQMNLLIVMILKNIQYLGVTIV